MVRFVRFTLALGLLIWMGGAAFAAEPAMGSHERAAILDALRPAVEADLAAPIGFRISRIEVLRDWAYVSCIPTRGPRPLDWAKTKYGKAFAQDMMTNMILALLRRDASSGWKVIEYALGPTDATWEEWAPKYSLPRSLFVPSGPNAIERDPEKSPIEGLAAKASPVTTPASPTGDIRSEDLEKALDAALGLRGSKDRESKPAPEMRR